MYAFYNKKKSKLEKMYRYGCISICRITLSHYWIALKGQKHQDRASPYYSGVSSQLALKGRNQDITLSGLFREVSFNP